MDVVAPRRSLRIAVGRASIYAASLFEERRVSGGMAGAYLSSAGGNRFRATLKHVWSLGKISRAAACCGMLLPAHVGTYASVGN